MPNPLREGQIGGLRLISAILVAEKSIRFQNYLNTKPLIPVRMNNWGQTFFTRTRRIGLLLSALLLGALPSAAFAQDTTEQGDSRALLVTPLSFVKERDLDFGRIIPGDTNGTVVMDSAGDVTTTGGITQINGSQQTARFFGFGAFNQTVLINSDADNYILTRDGGTDTILMDQILIGSQPPIVIDTNPRRFRIVNPAGFFSFTIAGRLQVASDQAPGVYNGEFTILLEYE